MAKKPFKPKSVALILALSAAAIIVAFLALTHRPAPKYVVTISAEVPNATALINGVLYSLPARIEATNGSTLIVEPQPVGDYEPVNKSIALKVSGNATVKLAYRKAYAYIYVQADAPNAAVVVEGKLYALPATIRVRNGSTIVIEPKPAGDYEPVNKTITITVTGNKSLTVNYYRAYMYVRIHADAPVLVNGSRMEGDVVVRARIGSKLALSSSCFHFGNGTRLCSSLAVVEGVATTEKLELNATLTVNSDLNVTIQGSRQYLVRFNIPEKASIFLNYITSKGNITVWRHNGSLAIWWPENASVIVAGACNSLNETHRICIVNWTGPGIRRDNAYLPILWINVTKPLNYTAITYISRKEELSVTINGSKFHILRFNVPDNLPVTINGSVTYLGSFELLWPHRKYIQVEGGCNRLNETHNYCIVGWIGRQIFLIGEIGEELLYTGYPIGECESGFWSEVVIPLNYTALAYIGWTKYPSVRGEVLYNGRRVEVKLVTSRAYLFLRELKYIGDGWWHVEGMLALELFLQPPGNWTVAKIHIKTKGCSHVYRTALVVLQARPHYSASGWAFTEGEYIFTLVNGKGRGEKIYEKGGSLTQVEAGLAAGWKGGPLNVPEVDAGWLELSFLGDTYFKVEFQG